MAAAAAVAVARTMLRSSPTSGRSATAGVTFAFRPRTTGSPIRIATQKPLSARIFRSPVELSCVGALPYHSATASALLISMLTVNPRLYGWTLEGL